MKGKTIYISAVLLGITCILLMGVLSSFDHKERKNVGPLPVIYSIDASTVKGENDFFWKAAGHDFLFPLSMDSSGQYLLNRMQQYHSVKYLRTHNTFSNSTSGDKTMGQKIGGQVVRKNKNGAYYFDFSLVNRTYHELVKRGIKPIVEFDFYPDNLSKGKRDRNSEGFIGHSSAPANWKEWENLLNSFMQNLINEFGQEELESWYFEVWNEPDNWPVDHLDGFFRLYDTFSSVVKSYNPEFKVGGPGCFNKYFLKPFLEHVTHQTNFITGKKGAPIDFISYHIYGLSGEWLNKAPDIRPSVSHFTTELLWVQRMIARYPSLAKTALHINEWGVVSNFAREVKDYPDLEYRNSEFSPLFMAKLVDCIFALKDNYNLNLSMLLYWGFSWEAYKNVMFSGNRELTTGNNIPKPILTGFELLSFLKKYRLSVKGPQPGGRFGVIPTTDNKNELSILAYNFNEEDDELDRKDLISLKISNIAGSRPVTIETYTLDRNKNNNYRSWVNSGKPASLKDLDKNLLNSQHIRSEQLTRFDQHNRNITLDLKLPRHSMIVINIHY